MTTVIVAIGSFPKMLRYSLLYSRWALLLSLQHQTGAASSIEANILAACLLMMFFLLDAAVRHCLPKENYGCCGDPES